MTQLPDAVGPPLEQVRGVGGVGRHDEHGMERPGRAGLEDGIAQEGLDPYLDGAISIGGPHGAVVVLTAHESHQHAGRAGTRVVGQHGHPLRAQLALPSPALVGMVRGLQEREVGPL